MKTIHRVLSEDLGDGLAMMPRRKNWITAALGAAGLASSVIGGVQASKAAKAAEKRQREQEASDNAYFTRRYNESILDRDDGQNFIRKAIEGYDKGLKQAEGASKVAGGTDAATAMAKETKAKGVGEAIANLAAMDASRKDQIDAQRQASQQRYMQMDMNREQARANSIAQAAQGASNAIMSAAVALGQDNTGADLTGGSNKSTPASDAAAIATTRTLQRAASDDIRRRLEEEAAASLAGSPYYRP